MFTRSVASTTFPAVFRFSLIRERPLCSHTTLLSERFIAKLLCTSEMVIAIMAMALKEAEIATTRPIRVVGYTSP